MAFAIAHRASVSIKIAKANAEIKTYKADNGEVACTIAIVRAKNDHPMASSTAAAN